MAMTHGERQRLMAELAVMVEAVSDLADRLAAVTEGATNVHRQRLPPGEQGAHSVVRDQPASSEDAP
jgi:hypothetical protein